MKMDAIPGCTPLVQKGWRSAVKDDKGADELAFSLKVRNAILLDARLSCLGVRHELPCASTIFVARRRGWPGFYAEYATGGQGDCRAW